MRQHPSEDLRVIARAEELALGLHQARELVDRLGLDEAAAMVAIFWPWIGIEQYDAVEHFICTMGEQVARIALIDADIAIGARIDGARQFRDAIEIRLTSDEAAIALLAHLGEEIFTAAKADFQA